MAKPQVNSLDNILKISLIFGILLSALSLAYYLLVYIPKKDATIVSTQNQTVTVTPSPTPTPTAIVTPLPTVKTTPKPAAAAKTGCVQSQLDNFRKVAIANGYDSAVVDSFIAAQKANGCKTPTQLDNIESQLDKVRNCQMYGQCY